MVANITKGVAMSVITQITTAGFIANALNGFKVRLGVALIVAAVFGSSSQSSFAALTYDATRPIYDSTRVAHRLDELSTVLSAAYQAGKPVIIYVHGRGNEPEKSFNSQMTGGGALLRLSSEYDASVVMINWNSVAKGSDRREPLKHVGEGAVTLNSVLKQLVEYQKEHPNAARPSLLVHSMGSIVLAESVEKFGWPSVVGHSIFSNVLLSEADADSQGHNTWLSTLAKSERVYVTQNRKDSVLKKSTDARNPPSNFALGLDPVPPLSKEANYIDLTEALKVKKVVLIPIGAHQIFSKSWMGRNSDTCMFVSKTLRGESYELTSIPGVSQVSPGRYKAAKLVDKSEVTGGDNE
jgi:hypothetical protein